MQGCGGTEAELRCTADIRKKNVGHEIGVQRQQFHLLKPCLRPCRLVQRAGAPHVGIAQGRDNGLQVIGLQKHVAVADDENVVQRVLQPSNHVVDLTVAAGAEVFDRDGYPLSPEFLLQFLQQWNGCILFVLHGKNDLEFRVILDATAAQVFPLILFQAMDRFQNGDWRPLLPGALR